jgi:hypothetical protein
MADDEAGTGPSVARAVIPTALLLSSSTHSRSGNSSSLPPGSGSGAMDALGLHDDDDDDDGFPPLARVDADSDGEGGGRQGGPLAVSIGTVRLHQLRASQFGDGTQPKVRAWCATVRALVA